MTYTLPDALTPVFQGFLTTSPHDLTSEIALLRVLINEAVGAQQYTRAAALLSIVAKASSISQANAVRANALVEAKTVGRIALELVRLLGETLQGKYPGWEDDLAVLSTRVEEVVTTPARITLEE